MQWNQHSHRCICYHDGSPGACLHKLWVFSLCIINHPFVWEPAALWNEESNQSISDGLKPFNVWLYYKGFHIQEISHSVYLSMNSTTFYPFFRPAVRHLKYGMSWWCCSFIELLMVFIGVCSLHTDASLSWEPPGLAFTRVIHCYMVVLSQLLPRGNLLTGWPWHCALAHVWHSWNDKTEHIEFDMTEM